MGDGTLPAYVAINGKKVSIQHLSLSIESALEAAQDRELKTCEECGKKIAPHNQKLYASSTEPEKSGIYHRECGP